MTDTEKLQKAMEKLERMHLTNEQQKRDIDFYKWIVRLQENQIKTYEAILKGDNNNG